MKRFNLMAGFLLLTTISFFSNHVAAQPGAMDTTFNVSDAGFGSGTGVNNLIYSSVLQPDGKSIMVGDFNSVNGTSKSFIARLTANGTLDNSFNVTANSSIQAVALQADGKIVIGGFFSVINGTSISRIARLNSNGSLDNTFNPGTGANNGVNTIVIQSDGKIVVGGSFTTINGIAANYITRLNTDGSLDNTFNPGTGANSTVQTIALQTDGKVIIGGSFTTVNGTATRIARLNTNGSLDNTFTPGTGPNSNIQSIVLQADGKIVIGGSFSVYNGTAANYFARLNTNGTLDSSFITGTGANSTVMTLSIQPNGKIILSGYFTTYNGTSINRIARVNTDGSFDTSFNPGTGANDLVFFATIQPNEKIIIGGYFTTFNGVALNRIARLNSDGSLDNSFNPKSGASDIVQASALQSDGKIIIGGNFTTFNNTTANRVARLNSDGSLDNTFNTGTGFNSTVNAVAVQPDGKIIVGGSFNNFNSTAINNIARLNSNGSLDNTFAIGTGANGSVSSITLQPDGKIILGGSFSVLNGTSINRVARLNADGSIDNTFTPVFVSGSVLAASLQSDGKIIIAGSFTSPRNYIARLNVNGSFDATFNPGTGASSNINSVALHPSGKIIIGGSFSSYNGIPINFIARINSDGSLDNLFNPISGATGANSTVQVARMQPDGKIIIGGFFTTYNGVSRNQLARLNSDGSLDNSFNPGIGSNNSVYSATLQSDGKIIIGGGFTAYNGKGRNRIARVLNTFLEPVADIGIVRNGALIPSGATLGFPTAAIASTSTTFTLVNNGVADLVLVGSPSIGITGAGDFVLTPPALSALTPGQSTTFSVTFTPLDSGLRTAQLFINSNDPDNSDFRINFKGSSKNFYGPKYPPIGTISQSTNGNEAGRVGGRDLFITGVSLAERTATYWGPQINSQGELQLKLSLDGSTHTGKEIFTFDPASSNLPNGVVVWKGETKIQNAVTGQLVTVYTRATLTTKRLNNSIVPMINPLSLGLSEQVGGLVKINDVSDYLVAKFFIEASTSATGGFQPYLNFYDAYPTPAGPLPGQGIGAAYSSITNGFYWNNLPPRLTTNAIFDLDEGAGKAITTSYLNVIDEDEDALNPETIVFEFKTEGPGSNPMTFGTGSIKKDGVALTKADVFTLKDVIDEKISFQHNSSETMYDEFQFSLKDKKGTYAIDGDHTIFSFKIGVNPVNDPPVIQGLNYESSYAYLLTDTLTATDPEGDTITFQQVSAPASGNVAINGNVLTYTPAGAIGPVSFQYRAYDGTNFSNTATISINLIDLPPIAIDQSITTSEGSSTGAAFNVTDVEGGDITFEIIESPSHGELTIGSSGFSYSPDENFFGHDEFIYTATDSNDGTSQAVVSITVRPSLDLGDLLISNESRITLVDPIHGFDAVLFEGDGLQEVQQTIYKQGGSLYVLDKANGLLRINPANGVQTVLLSASNFTSNPGPLGMMENAAGEIIITDGSNGIRKVNTETNAISALSSGGSLVLPAGIVQHPDGSYIISDAGLFAGQSSKIIRIAPNGTQTIISQGGNLKIPVDLELLDANTVIVNDGGSLAGASDAIIKVNLTTGQQTVVTTGGQLNWPTGGAYSSVASKLFVINQNNSKLVEINPVNGLQTQLAMQSTISHPFGLSIIVPHTKQSQTITFDSVASKTYGDASFILNAVASSGLRVTFSSGNTSVATVSDSMVTIVGAGEAIITASQAGNEDYVSAAAEQTLIINKTQLIVTARDTVKVYGAQNPPFTLTYAGFKASETVAVLDTPPVGTSTATAASSPGTYPITPGGGSDQNYAFQYVNGTLTITGTLPNVYVATPADGATGQKTKLAIAARTVTGASIYTIQLSLNSSFSSGVRTKSGARSQTFDSLAYNTKYYARVKTNLNPAYGKVTSFTTIAAELLAYVLTPKDSAVKQKVTLSVTTNLVPLAQEYTIELNTSSDFTGTSIVQTGGRTQNFAGLNYNTTYYSRVRTEFTSNWGKTRQFRTLESLSINYVVTPKDNAVDQNAKLNITANSVVNATQYSIQLSKSANFDTIDFEVTGSTRTLTFEGLNYNTIYYNRVKTNLTPDFGVVRSFKTRTAESLAYVTSPVDNAVDKSTSLKITANPVLYATGYTIQLSESSDFDTVNFEVSGATRILSFAALKYNTRYYNRVKTNLTSNFGVVRSFVTRTAESLSYVTSPAEGTVVKPATVKVTSNIVPGASYYTIQLSETADFDSVSFQGTSSTRYVTFTGLRSGAHYYNRVRTDISSEFGVVKSFNTLGEAAAAAPGDHAAPAGRLASPIGSEVNDEEFGSLGIEVYPNPFKEKLTVRIFSQTEAEANVTLTDLTGKVMHQANYLTNSTIDLDDKMPAGLYLLKIRVGGTSRVVKVLRTE